MSVSQALGLLAERINILENKYKTKPDVFFGTVASLEPFSVVIDGDTQPSVCARAVNAEINDRVVLVKRGTQLVATAVVNPSLPQSGITMDLIWTNQDQSKTFIPQTISLDLTLYDFVFIESKFHTTLDNYCCAVIHVGRTGSQTLNYGISSSFYTTFFERQITVNNSNIVFGSAYGKQPQAASPTINNDFIVPCEIYGIRL